MYIIVLSFCCKVVENDIKTSAAILKNYNEIAHLCKTTKEPVSY
jgi:hypothetical protein